MTATNTTHVNKKKCGHKLPKSVIVFETHYETYKVKY